MKKFTKILPRRLQGRNGAAAGNGDDGRSSGPGLSDARDHHQLTSRRGAALVKRPTRTGQSRISVLPLDEGLEEASLNEDVAENEHAESLAGLNKDSEDGDGTDKGQRNGRTAQEAIPEIPIICQHCAAIGFPRLFDWQPGSPRPWVSLTHALSDTSTCPYCTFFQAMIGYVPATEGGTGGSRTAPSGGGDSETPSISESDAGNSSASYTGTFTPYLRILHAFERLGVNQKHEIGKQILFEVMTKNKALPRGYILRCVEDEMALDGYLDAPARKSRSSDETSKQSGDTDTAASKQPAARIKGRSVPRKLDPALPKCWMDYCATKHGELRCGAASPGPKDLKLVDVETHNVVAANEVDAELKYVTLSYAAGDPQSLDPDESSAEGHLPTELPQLIKDALSLTASLGYRYIWIHRYCVLDFENTAARRRYLDSLGDVFSSSALTIVVAAGSGVTDGIPGISVPREDQLSLLNESGLFTTSLVRTDMEIAASKWASRTWTLQEGLLSRRRLILTPSQAYFQCSELHCHESVSLPLRHAPDFAIGRVFPLDGVRAMDVRAFIGAYMARGFSKIADRLDACRSLLRAFAKREDGPVDTFLGLPLFEPEAFANLRIVSQTDRLAVGLSWLVAGRASTPGTSALRAAASDAGPCFLDDSFYFPSWSWLAWRIRSDSDAAQNPRSFRIHLANDVAAAAPAMDGLCAPPGTEMSIGFTDGLVVSWEIDGEAIARRTERIAFLRMRTFCFDVRVAMQTADGVEGLSILEPEGVLDLTARENILSAAKASGYSLSGKGEVKLVAVLIAGRNWKGENGKGEREATALLCAHRQWDEEQPFVRIGLFGITYSEFVQESGSGSEGAGDGHATLKGVVAADVERGALKTDVREIDLY